MIAICLVIVDRLFHEDIWRAWLSQADHPDARYSARLFIQAKHPEKVQSEWVRQFVIPISFCPTWNSPEVVRAMLATADEAIKYEQNGSVCDRFIFGTEFCIPIRSLEDTGRIVFEQEKSWLAARHLPSDNWEKAHCFDAVKSTMIPPEVFDLTELNDLDCLGLFHLIYSTLSGGVEKLTRLDSLNATPRCGSPRSRTSIRWL